MKLALIGDYSPAYPSQQATQEALRHSAKALAMEIEEVWVPTPLLARQGCSALAAYSGYWIAPGSPDSPDGVLTAIRNARERDIPLLGTCGGFQSILLEFIRNRLNIADAEHEERSPDSAHLAVRELACSLVGQDGQVRITPDSEAYACYKTSETVESFRCRYGLNPVYRDRVEEAGM